MYFPTISARTSRHLEIDDERVALTLSYFLFLLLIFTIYNFQFWFHAYSAIRLYNLVAMQFPTWVGQYKYDVFNSYIEFISVISTNNISMACAYSYAACSKTEISSQR